MVYTVGKNGHEVKTVYLKGVDVTTNCFYAKTGIFGKVGLYKLNSTGKYYVDHANNVATEFKRGKVAVVLKEVLS